MARTRFWLSAGSLALGFVLVAAVGCGGSGSSSGSASGKKVDVLRVNLHTDTDYTDPALAYYQVSWQFEYATCLKLLNYPDKAGAEGLQLQPEAAESMPTVSSDGKTYTFTVKSGFKFSPPSNEAVTAETFRHVIERDLNPKMQSASASFMHDIAGEADYVAGKSKHISGVQVNGNKLKITLDGVAPDFLSRIAMPFFCAVPLDTPIDPKGVRTVASAGPYYIAAYTPKRRIVIKKNPNYNGDRTANVGEIDYRVGVNQDQSVLEIKQGKADYHADQVAPGAVADLLAQFGPDSSAAKSDKQQYFVNPLLGFGYLAINTSRPPFDNLKIRQAISYAIDRPTLIKQAGPRTGTPADQYLPPRMPGYKDVEIYPTAGPDVAKAKQLIAASGVKTPIKAVLYTSTTSPGPEQAEVFQSNLKEIGIDVQIKQFERAVQFEKEGTKDEPFDLGNEGWLADYADPYDFINILLNGENIQKTGNVNFAYLNDPTFNKRMDDAARLSGKAREAAYADLDADLAKDSAPLASWEYILNPDFFSARIGCQVWSAYTMDLTQLCLR
jgi:ABC-type oligopeptide transport system substrate-binding subunit